MRRQNIQTCRRQVILNIMHVSCHNLHNASNIAVLLCTAQELHVKARSVILSQTWATAIPAYPPVYPCTYHRIRISAIARIIDYIIAFTSRHLLKTSRIQTSWVVTWIYTYLSRRKRRPRRNTKVTGTQKAVHSWYKPAVERWLTRKEIYHTEITKGYEGKWDDEHIDSKSISVVKPETNVEIHYYTRPPTQQHSKIYAEVHIQIQTMDSNQTSLKGGLSQRLQWYILIIRTKETKRNMDSRVSQAVK